MAEQGSRIASRRPCDDGRRVPCCAMDDGACGARAARPACGTGCGWTRSARPSTSRSPPRGRSGRRPSAGRPRSARASRSRRPSWRRWRRSATRRSRASRAPRPASAASSRWCPTSSRSPGSSRGWCSTSPPPTATTRHDPMRPAEALVLFDFYSDPIDRAARARRDRLDRRRGLHRLASCSARRRSRCGWRSCSGSARRASSPGALIPGVAIAFNAVGNERRTRALADKAIRFYGG